MWKACGIRWVRRDGGRRSTYGDALPRYQPNRWYALGRAGALATFALLLAPTVASARTVRLVAFGDSLMAGYNLPAGQDFPTRLQAALSADGFDVAMTNASVSGDTTAGGRERLDWSVPDGTDGVILELGANDMLRGQDPARTRQNLAAMLDSLKARRITVYLLGMKADPALGPDYGARFDAIYSDLARTTGSPLDPFVLEGVAGHRDLQLQDGMHPNEAGVAAMVARIKPGVEAWLKTLPTGSD